MLQSNMGHIASRDTHFGLQETQPAPPKIYPGPPKGREPELAGLANVAQRLLSP